MHLNDYSLPGPKPLGQEEAILHFFDNAKKIPAELEPELERLVYDPKFLKEFKDDYLTCDKVREKWRSRGPSARLSGARARANRAGKLYKIVAVTLPERQRMKAYFAVLRLSNFVQPQKLRN